MNQINFDKFSKDRDFQNKLKIDLKNNSEQIPMVNEIFLIDPQTNQVHSIIRQIIPNGDRGISEMAINQLKNHLEGDMQEKMSQVSEISRDNETMLNLNNFVSINT